MTVIRLKSFIKPSLDILFIGLNPGSVSNQNGHYFSSNSSLWNQLFLSGLICQAVDKKGADDKIFGSNTLNFRNWKYGIIDLVPDIVNSDSRVVNPKREHYDYLVSLVAKYKPLVAVIIHNKVVRCFQQYSINWTYSWNYGKLGNLICDSSTIYFNIPFPSGNNIPSELKIKLYVELRNYLLKIKYLHAIL